MSGGGWGHVRSEIWRPFHKNEKIVKNSILGARAEFPYLGIIRQYQVFLILEIRRQAPKIKNGIFQKNFIYWKGL